MKTTGSKQVRAALYARVSTTGHGQDVGLQLDELKQVAQQRGWHFDTYIDEGVSGSAESRPELDRMLADARAGRITLIAVWKLDRLGRSLKHLLQMLDEFTRLGVDFLSVRDTGIDTTSPQGRLMIQLLGAFSEFERAMIQERVQAGVQRAKAKGVHCGRPEVTLDIRPAMALLREGRALNETAKILGIARNCPAPRKAVQL